MIKASQTSVKSTSSGQHNKTGAKVSLFPAKVLCTAAGISRKDPGMCDKNPRAYELKDFLWQTGFF